MNILRHEHLYFAFTKTELVAALRRAYPKEFMLRKIPADMKQVSMSVDDKTGKLLIEAMIEVGGPALDERRENGDAA